MEHSSFPKPTSSTAMAWCGGSLLGRSIGLRRRLRISSVSSDGLADNLASFVSSIKSEVEFSPGTFSGPPAYFSPKGFLGMRRHPSKFSLSHAIAIVAVAVAGLAAVVLAKETKGSGQTSPQLQRVASLVVEL